MTTKYVEKFRLSAVENVSKNNWSIAFGYPGLLKNSFIFKIPYVLIPDALKAT